MTCIFGVFSRNCRIAISRMSQQFPFNFLRLWRGSYTKILLQLQSNYLHKYITNELKIKICSCILNIFNIFHYIKFICIFYICMHACLYVYVCVYVLSYIIVCMYANINVWMQRVTMINYCSINYTSLIKFWKILKDNIIEWKS